MTQVVTVVRHALRLLRVLDAESTPEPQQAQDAVDALNRMMTRWEADGLALGWQNVTIDDDLPTDPQCDEALGYNLAVRLQPEYGVALSDAVIAQARSGEGAMRADMITNRFYITSTPDLPVAEGQTGTGAGWQAGLNA